MDVPIDVANANAFVVANKKRISHRKMLHFMIKNFPFFFLVTMPEGEVAEKKRGRPAAAAKEDKVNSDTL